MNIAQKISVSSDYLNAPFGGAPLDVGPVNINRQLKSPFHLPHAVAIDENGQIWLRWKLTVESGSAWETWQNIVVPDGFIAIDVAIAALSDGRVEMFSVGKDGTIIFCYQLPVRDITGCQWTAWDNWTPPAGKDLISVYVFRLSDARIQLWTVASDGTIFTRWKLTASSSADWSQWAAFNGPVGEVVTLAGAPLSDGRLQIWACLADGSVKTCWKVTSDSASAWTDWSAFSVDKLSGAKSLTGAPHLDGRTQLWLTDTTGKVWSTRKVSPDSESSWSPLSLFPVPPNSSVSFLASARFRDGRDQIWGVIDGGSIMTCWTKSPDPQSTWTDWSSF